MQFQTTSESRTVQNAESVQCLGVIPVSNVPGEPGLSEIEESSQLRYRSPACCSSQCVPEKIVLPTFIEIL
jgi:hypothetical protein